jgi:hypothetical protein
VTSLAHKTGVSHISWSIRRGHSSLRRGAAQRPLSHDGVLPSLPKIA